MLKIKGFKKIENESDFMLITSQIRDNIEKNLKSIGARVIADENRIEFKRIIKNTTHTGNNYTNAMKIFREGEFIIENVDENFIGLRYSVNSEFLIFQSIGFGILIGLFVFSIPVSIYLGLSISLLIFIIGYLWIKYRVHIIVKNSLPDKRK
jgi:hypothetical protein